MADVTKVCNTCSVEKPLSDFYPQYRCATVRNICKKCENRKGRQRTRELETGWTPEQYDAAYATQEGRCAICRRHQSELTRALAADHDHATGERRSLLCSPCNLGLGYFRDSPDLLRVAANYLS